MNKKYLNPITLIQTEISYVVRVVSRYPHIPEIEYMIAHKFQFWILNGAKTDICGSVELSKEKSKAIARCNVLSIQFRQYSIPE